MKALPRIGAVLVTAVMLILLMKRSLDKHPNNSAFNREMRVQRLPFPVDEEDEEPSRLQTDLPHRESQEEEDDSKNPNSESFIPDGPDETPPLQPATIPKKFIIDEPDFCQRRSNLDIIAYIHSSIKRATERHETRVTWANATAQGFSVRIGVVFMVGRAKSKEEQLAIQKESDLYHDIIQGDYGDHYRLLTYKGLASLYWIKLHCPEVRWTMHADDDVYLDPFLYLEEIEKLSEEAKEQFICSHMYGPAIRSERWKVSYKEYPITNYPLYCSGGVWALQTKFIPKLLEASKVVPFLWVDDAYITGLLAKVAEIKQYPFHGKYGGEGIGTKVAWFIRKESRAAWWKKTLDYYRSNRTLIK